jgi:hypothetical protein
VINNHDIEYNQGLSIGIGAFYNGHNSDIKHAKSVNSLIVSTGCVCLFVTGKKTNGPLI